MIYTSESMVAANTSCFWRREPVSWNLTHLGSSLAEPSVSVTALASELAEEVGVLRLYRMVRQ